MINMLMTNLFLNRLRKNNIVRFHKSNEKGRRGELGRILHLPLGYSCNNNCRYCLHTKKRELNRSTAECKKLLKEERKYRNLLILSGGEPTIRKDFFELIAYARNLSYEWIQLKTNGRIFFYHEFAKKIVYILCNNPVSKIYRSFNDEYGYNYGSLGIFEFNIPLYSHLPEVHDSITRIRGSFKQTVKGIRNLKKLNQIILITIPILNENYKDLIEIIKFASLLDVEQITLNFTRINNQITTKPRLSVIKSYIMDLLEKSSKNIRNKNYKDALKLKSIFCENIPPCNIVGYEKIRRAELYYPYDRHKMYKFIDFGKHYTYNNYENKYKRKGKKCFSCVYDQICYGIWKNYLDLYGESELKPIFANNVDETQLPALKDMSKVKLENLKFEFENDNLKFNFEGIDADAVVHFSGGIDSSLVAALYAKNNKHQKIVLLTYDNIPPPSGGLSKDTANFLMKKYSNIIRHFIIPIPYILSKKIIFENLEETYKKNNNYITCFACKGLRFAYTIYLLKRYFKGDVILAGLKVDEGPIDQEETFKKWLEKYSIKIILPLRENSINKRKIIKLAKKEIPVSNFYNQSLCWANFIKSRLGWRAMQEVEKSRKKILEELDYLLNKNGIYP